MTKLFLITGYDSFNNKVVNKFFKVPSEALDFSLLLTDPKMTVLNGENDIQIINNYLQGV